MLAREEIKRLDDNIEGLNEIINSDDKIYLKNTVLHRKYLNAMNKLSTINYYKYINDSLGDVYVCKTTMSIIKAIIDKITTMNMDWFVSVVGYNGSGKSTFSYGFIDGYCKLLNFDTAEVVRKNTIYDEEDFFQYLANIREKRPLEPVFLDEGANILFNRDSMSKNRKWIIKFINVMRYLNKLVIITSLKGTMLDKVIRQQRIKSIIYISNDISGVDAGIRTAKYYEGDDIYRFYNYEENSKAYMLPDTDFILQFRENTHIADVVLDIKKKYTSNLETVAKIELLKSKLRKLKDILALRKDLDSADDYIGISIDDGIKSKIDEIIRKISKEINEIDLGV